MSCRICLLPAEHIDYTKVNRTFELTDLETSACVDIEIIDDTSFEMDETILMMLNSNDFSDFIDLDETEITIKDNDGMSHFHYTSPLKHYPLSVIVCGLV